MLHLFRRGVKTWVAKLLLGLLILSFAIWGIGDIFLGRTASSVASVGATEVDADRYAQMVQRERHLATINRQEVVTYDDLRQAGIDRQILSTLVREAAYTEELDTLGIGVSSAEVADTIRKNPAFLNNEGRFDLARYNERLSQYGYNGPQFEAATRGLLGQAILAGAIRMGTVPDSTAETIAKWRGELRGVSTVALTPDMAAEPADADEATLKAFFEADSAPFREPERRWGRYIRLNPAELARQIDPSDDEIRTEYEARIANYTVKPARTVEQIVFTDETKAQDAANRIADGTSSFAEIAAEQNISVANLSLGQVTKGELSDAVDSAIFATEEPGVVGPVKVLDGFALLNITKIQKGGAKPLEDVRDELATALATRHAAALARQKATEIDEIRAGGATMEDLATKLDVPIVRFEGLGPDGTVAEGDVPALAADPKFVAEVQAAHVGDERNVIELTDGGYALVMVERIAEAHLPEFAEVKDKVMAAWKAEERMKALEIRAGRLLLDAGEGGLAAVATALGEDSPVELPPMARGQMPQLIGSDLRDQVFKAKEGDVVIGRTPGNQSVLIVLVREVQPVEGEALAAATKEIDDAMSKTLEQDVLEYYGRALEERHGATFSQSAIDSVFERLSQVGY